MKTLPLTSLSLLVTLAAQAAQVTKLDKADSLARFEAPTQQICKSMQENNFDCEVNVYKIVSKKRSEKLVNSVKQMIYIGLAPYVHEVDAQLLSRGGENEAIFTAINNVLKAGGVDENNSTTLPKETLEAQDLLVEGLSNDVDNSYYSFVGGHLKGAFSLDRHFFALIDRRNGEVVIFSAGVSE